ncbi:MAG: CRISPR-associated endonuclease Cas2 [Chitinophagales bacterium]|nr:CRISPR-associated endonuclease Cas2 [Chitinophagales bacterium]
MNKKNIFLISYDISDNKKRAKIAKLLERSGYERIQYSVFTGLMAPHRNKELWKRLQKFTDTGEYPEDKLISFAISKTSFRNMKIIGSFAADLKYLLGEKHTEVF